MTPYQTATHAYQAGRTLGAHPIDLILMTYNEALAGCFEKNGLRARGAVVALKNSLDHDRFTSLSMHLEHIYDHCLYLIHKQQFEQSAQLLTEIRDAWREARSKQTDG
ncbi:MAG: hypothetical protein R2834_00985 [Rhodothermales bacterium]